MYIYDVYIYENERRNRQYDIAISHICNQAMGRIGEVVGRTWQTAAKMKMQRGQLPEDKGSSNDNTRVKRFCFLFFFLFLFWFLSFFFSFFLFRLEGKSPCISFRGNAELVFRIVFTTCVRLHTNTIRVHVHAYVGSCERILSTVCTHVHA